MTQSDDFGKPDREGFEGLLRSGFFLFEGLLLLGSTNLNADSARKLLTEGSSKKELQWYFNHVSLFLYVADNSLQRKWADELETRWKERVSKQFPQIKVSFEREDEEEEIIVWFWNT